MLLVDDVKLFLELEKNLLSRSSLRLFTALSGQEAIEVHKREHVDLILCDFYMPDMHGDEVTRIIRNDKTMQRVSIILVTTSLKDIDMCLKAGANDYILKPINPIELLKKVGKYINIPMRKDIRILVRMGVEGRSGGSESFFGNTKNMSVSGVLIETSHAFTVGEMLFCSFFIPGNFTPITVTGEITRKGESSQIGLNCYGIKFININEEDKWVIENYILRHPEAKLEPTLPNPT